MKTLVKATEPNLPENAQNVFVMKKKKTCDKCMKANKLCMCGKKKLMIKKDGETTEKSLLIKARKTADGKRRKTYQIGEVSEITGKKKIGPGKWVDPKTGKVSSSPKADGKKPESKPKGEEGKPEVSPELEAKITEIAKKKGIPVTKQLIEAVTDDIAGGSVTRRGEAAIAGAKQGLEEAGKVEGQQQQQTQQQPAKKPEPKEKPEKKKPDPKETDSEKQKPKATVKKKKQKKKVTVKKKESKSWDSMSNQEKEDHAQDLVSKVDNEKEHSKFRDEIKMADDFDELGEIVDRMKETIKKQKKKK